MLGWNGFHSSTSDSCRPLPPFSSAVWNTLSAKDVSLPSFNSVVLALCQSWHLKESVYSRYAIADETSLKDAAVKLAALHDAGRLSTTVPSHLSKQSQSKVAVSSQTITRITETL